MPVKIFIKNDYDENVERVIDSLISSPKGNNLYEVLLIMENNAYFKQIRDLKIRFWEMFIVDALIGNNDRNEGNWGLIVDKETSTMRIAPVFDNGASFNSKASDNKLSAIYNDNFKFRQSVYESSRSIFTEDERYINPLKFIESMKNDDCNQAIIRIIPKIKLEKIKQIFFELPTEFEGLTVLSEIQREFYLNTIVYRYEKILLPAYNKLLNK